MSCVFFFQAEDGIRDHCVTGVQTCALPISLGTLKCCGCLADGMVVVPRTARAKPGAAPAQRSPRSTRPCRGPASWHVRKLFDFPISTETGNKRHSQASSGRRSALALSTPSGVLPSGLYSSLCAELQNLTLKAVPPLISAKFVL